MWDTVKEFETLGNRTVMAILLLLIIVGFIWMFWRASKNETNEFDIMDIFMESGKASKWSIILIGAFTIHSWVLVSWTINGAATLADLTTYGGTWVGPVIAKMFVSTPKE